MIGSRLLDRWRLKIIDAAGDVVHEELFTWRAQAEKIGRFYVKPLAPFLPRMCTYTVERNRS